MFRNLKVKSGDSFRRGGSRQKVDEPDLSAKEGDDERTASVKDTLNKMKQRAPGFDAKLHNRKPEPDKGVSPSSSFMQKMNQVGGNKPMSKLATNAAGSAQKMGQSMGAGVGSPLTTKAPQRPFQNNVRNAATAMKNRGPQMKGGSVFGGMTRSGGGAVRKAGFGR